MKKTFLARLAAFAAAAAMTVSPIGMDALTFAVSAEEPAAVETQENAETPDGDGQENEEAYLNNDDEYQIWGDYSVETDTVDNAIEETDTYTVSIKDQALEVVLKGKSLADGAKVAKNSEIYIGVVADNYINHRIKINGETLEVGPNGDGYLIGNSYIVKNNITVELVEEEWSEEELSDYAVLAVGNNINVYPYNENGNYAATNYLLATGNHYPKGLKLVIRVPNQLLDGDKYLSINGEEAEGTVNDDGYFQVWGYTVKDDEVEIAIEGLESYIITCNDPDIMIATDDLEEIASGTSVEENTLLYIGTKLDNYIDHRLKINGKTAELKANGDVYYFYTYLYVKEDTVIELVEDKWSKEELSNYAVLTVGNNINVYPYNEYYDSAATDYPLATGNHYPKGAKLVIRASKDDLAENERIFINGEKAEAYLNDDNEYQIWGYSVETDAVNITIEEIDTYTVSIKDQALLAVLGNDYLTDGAKVDKDSEIYISALVDDYINHRIKVNGKTLEVVPNGDGYRVGGSYIVESNITVELAEEEWTDEELSNYVVFDIDSDINVYPYNSYTGLTDVTHPYKTGNYLPKGQMIVIRIANELLSDGKSLLVNGDLVSGSVNADGEFQVWGYPVNCKENTLSISVGMAGVSLKNNTTGTSDIFDSIESAIAYINKNGKASYEYEIILGHNAEVRKLTLPTASKASVLTISGNGNTITMGNNALSVPMNIVFDNVRLESSNARGYTLTASKNVDMSGFVSDTLTSIKGAARFKLALYGEANLTYQVAGFGTAAVYNTGSDYYVDVNKSVTVNDLELNGHVVIRAGAKVTVKNITGKDNAVVFYDDGFTPITVNGNAAGTIVVGRCGDERFNNGQLLIVSKTADVSAFRVSASAPDDTNKYVLSRTGSNLYIKKAVLRVYEYADNNYESVLDEYYFAEWNDLISAINAKKQSNIEYSVILTDDYDANGPLTMPKAGTYERIVVEGGLHTLTFTGNITLTGNADFSNIKLDSVKNVKNVKTSAPFKFIAGKYALDTLYNVNAPMLTDITGSGYVSVSECDLKANVSSQDVGLWGAKIGGNVTAKGTMELYRDVYIGKNISAVKIASYEENTKLSVVNGQKFTIGKGGVYTEKGSITLSVLNSNGEAYSVPAAKVIATIAGNYAGGFKLSDECGGDKLSAVKSGKNIIAAETDKLICMTDKNGKNYSYAYLADAMNDITAIGDPSGEYTIIVTDEAVLAKFPAAKKYKKITFVGGGKLKTASNLTLTGDISLDEITVTKYNAKKGTEDLPINVNVGSYRLFGGQNISCINNINGKGYLNIYGASDVSISGNVNVGVLDLYSVDLVLGKKSSFTVNRLCSGEDVTVTYYTSNAAKMKITDIYNYTNNETDDYSLTLKLLDANGNAEKLSENKSISAASIIGLYDPDRTVLFTDNIGSSNISLVRSGTKLVTTSSDNIIELISYYVDGEQVTNNKIGRFDSIGNVISEINRCNNRYGNYAVSFASDEPVEISLAKMPLPTAKKYNELKFVSYNSSVAINITSDIVLTGTLIVDGDITVRKTDKKGNVKPLTVKTGSYSIYGKEHFENATFKVK